MKNCRCLQTITYLRKALKNHSFDLVGKITIETSLYLSRDSHSIQPSISVQSLSQQPLSVSILLNTSDSLPVICQFVSNFESHLTIKPQNNFTELYFQGLLFEINQTFANMIINLDNDDVPCNGTIIVRDGLNEPLKKNIINISNYFKKYTKPELHPDSAMQIEVNRAPLYTGSYFVIFIDISIFNTTDDLSFELLNTDLASWLTVTSISISGTPPEPSWPQFWPSRYYTAIRVKNQYKHNDVDLVFEVQMSSTYYIKLLIKVLSLIGLWIYIYTIYNVLAKRLYRYPWKYVFRPGQEIMLSNMFPVAFIRNELKECKFIIKNLRSKVARELKLRSVSKQKLVEHFIDNNDNNRLDADLLSWTIDDMVIQMTAEQQNQVRSYTSTINPRKDIILQLVFNHLTTIRLHMNKDKQTLRVFRHIKQKWRDLVLVDDVNIWQFKANQTAILSALQSSGEHNRINTKELSIALPTIASNSSAMDSRTKISEESIHAELMKDSKKCEQTSIEKTALNINIDLLQNALIAHAFKEQHIDIETIFVNVVSKEKIKRRIPGLRILLKFLKLDLHPLLFDKGHKLGYGLRYKIVDDVLQFYGSISRTIVGKRLYVQIATKRGKILREISIRGDETNPEQIGFKRNKVSSNLDPKSKDESLVL